jgi:hypothetical protein
MWQFRMLDALSAVSLQKYCKGSVQGRKLRQHVASRSVSINGRVRVHIQNSKIVEKVKFG